MKTGLSALLLLLAAGWTMAADLSGTIRDDKNAPVPGATVRIYTARLRTGDSPMCPSCWADCGKSAATDAQGHFIIQGVSDRLVFRLLVIAKGYAPTFLPKVDPQAGPVASTVKVRDLSAFHDKQLLSGQVTDPAGKPVAGAVLDPDFDQKGLDALAITDDTGHFLFTCPDNIRSNRFTIRAEGFANSCASIESGGPAPLAIKLDRGVTVSGRVVRDGKPVAHVDVGLVQVDRSTDHWVGPLNVTTDANGLFHFDHAPAHQQLAVYGAMDSLAGLGALPVRTISTGAADSQLPMGDLAVQPAAAISGQLNETDGKPFTPGTRVSIGRDEAWDLQIIDVKPDGSFAAADIPTGEGIEVGVPRNHQIQKVTAGFQIDPLNSRVTGTLSQPTNHVAIDLIWKSQEDQWAEERDSLITSNYSAFFQQEKFTPAQIKLFVAAKLEEQDVAQAAQGNDAGYFVAKRKAEAAFEARVRSTLGPAVFGDYQRHETIDLGNNIISSFYQPPHDHWLTADQRQKLAEALGAVAQKQTAELQDTINTLPKAEQLAQTKRSLDEMEAAGLKVLPPDRHADYAKAMDDMRKLMSAMVSQD